MFLLVLRTLVVYVLIVAAMRLMGKKQVGELEPTELVFAMLISDLAAGIYHPHFKPCVAFH